MYWFLAAALVLMLLVILIRSFYERKTLSESFYEVALNKLPDALEGTEILFLSDLHNEEFGDSSALVRELERKTADILLIGGDMVTVKKGYSMDTHALEDILKAYSGKIPVLYALGNHETRMWERADEFPGWSDKFLTLIKKYQVTLLDNASYYLEKDDQRIRISGFTLDRKYYRKGHTEKMAVSVVEEMLGPSENIPEIVLVHSPLYGETFHQWGADLILSGHFHGGTIRIPFLGGLMTPQFQFFSPYTKGEKHFGDTTEIISGGLGTHSVRIRFLNKPDIVRIRLCRKK